MALGEREQPRNTVHASLGTVVQWPHPCDAMAAIERVVVVLGCTGAGKTKMSIELCGSVQFVPLRGAARCIALLRDVLLLKPCSLFEVQLCRDDRASTATFIVSHVHACLLLVIPACLCRGTLGLLQRSIHSWTLHNTRMCLTLHLELHLELTYRVE